MKGLIVGAGLEHAPRHPAVAPATAAGTSGLSAKFRWDSDDDIIDMSLEDACLVLEHWCKT